MAKSLSFLPHAELIKTVMKAQYNYNGEVSIGLAIIFYMRCRDALSPQS